MGFMAETALAWNADITALLFAQQPGRALTLINRAGFDLRALFPYVTAHSVRRLNDLAPPHT
jgi:hypothetical protein